MTWQPKPGQLKAGEAIAAAYPRKMEAIGMRRTLRQVGEDTVIRLPAPPARRRAGLIDQRRDIARLVPGSDALGMIRQDGAPLRRAPSRDSLATGALLPGAFDAVGRYHGQQGRVISQSRTVKAVVIQPAPNKSLCILHVLPPLAPRAGLLRTNTNGVTGDRLDKQAPAISVDKQIVVMATQAQDVAIAEIDIDPQHGRHVDRQTPQVLNQNKIHLHWFTPFALLYRRTRSLSRRSCAVLPELVSYLHAAISSGTHGPESVSSTRSQTLTPSARATLYSTRMPMPRPGVPMLPCHSRYAVAYATPALLARSTGSRIPCNSATSRTFSFSTSKPLPLKNYTPNIQHLISFVNISNPYLTGYLFRDILPAGRKETDQKGTPAMTTLITRMTKNLKAEAAAALAQIELDGYTVTGNTIACNDDTDGSFYGIWFFRSGEEVVAIPDFYVNEGSSAHTGSRGGEYTLDGETLTAGW